MNDNLKLKIDGVSIKQNNNFDGEWLPKTGNKQSFTPYDHQVSMNNLITNKDDFVAVNITLTGGGKTYSYAVPAINNNLFTIILFPTNALIEDQTRTIKELADSYYLNKDNISIVKLTSKSMQEYRNKKKKEDDINPKSVTNSQQIKNALQNAQENEGPSFILTNPDIFTNIYRGRYNYTCRSKLCSADMLVVDEFHNAKHKGRETLISIFDEIYHRKNNKRNLTKFVFLSATPDKNIQKHLKTKFGKINDTNFYHKITSKPFTKPTSKVKNNDNYRTVMPIIDIEFISGRAFSTKDKIISEEYNSEIINFLNNINNNNLGLIILDGLSEVNTVYNNLKPKLNGNLQPISGIRCSNTKHKLNTADHIIGNSTLEVGVDLGDVERMIFTGYNPSSFMQRLGRIRYTGNKNYKAVCFTTPNTINSLRSFKEHNAPYISRYMLENRVNQMLNSSSDMNLYKTEFAPIEMYRSIKETADRLTDESATEYLDRAFTLVEKHCFEDEDIEKEDINRLWEISQSPIGKSMQSYRNSMPSALMYDERTNDVKTYNIQTLLRIGDVEFLTEPEFDYRLKNRKNENPEIYNSEKQYVHTYAWFHKQIQTDKLRTVNIAPSNQIEHQLSLKPYNREVFILDTLEYTVDGEDDQIKGLNKLNKQLDMNIHDTENGILGYVTEGFPSELQQIYNLDEFFFTTPIDNLNGNYSIALGENSLYLNCHVKENIKKAQMLLNTC